MAFISVSLEHPRFNDEFIRLIQENASIAECHYIAGDFDFLLKVITQNGKTLEAVLNYIKSIFNSYGSVGQQMTGSGSAVFAIVSDFEFAAVICDMLKQNYPQVFIAKPV